MAELPADIVLITSPRKLQEMALPAAEGHDVTNASGVSMKQYEEQLNGLRKENFHLKLRIYFLEEKLGSGSPPAVQGLLEHNVRLQVEVEELRRQLSDKQELLAAAAEAIDVLEQQGSISTDSVEISINNSNTVKKEITTHDQDPEKKEMTVDDTCAESESAGDYLAVTVNNDDLDELMKLRRENKKALQMIKGCMKKIQQQDKEIKKVKLDKELVYAHVSDSQLEKYEEILKCKDEHIKDLENKVRDLQKHFEKVQNVDAGNLQQLLTRRLQGLAYFLDKLLSHKCVLGEDKKKLAESILEQSLALPVGLELDESMAPEEFTMDESNLDISQSLRMEDLTMMFGHHVISDDNRYSVHKKSLMKHFPQADIISESECWSEPDRNVSLARVGLCDTGVGLHESSSDNNKLRSRRARVSYGSRSEDNKLSNEALLEELNHISKRSEHLELENNDLNSKLEFSKEQINDLITENNELKETLLSEQENLIEANKTIETLKTTVVTLENRVKDVEQKLLDSTQTAERLRTERQELEATFMETERSLRRAADEATVQASQAALERARAQHDRLRIERELEETREKLSNALDANSQLEIEVTRKMALDANNKIAIVHEGLHSEEDRPTSPDQGIDSDRLSSLEQNDAVALSPRSLYEENVTLKQKLARTKATLAETLMQLNAANMRKRSVQRAICREIHKTQGVLRKARDQFENPN
ncbi:centrosomin isoform X2 [Trichoplusia ni]|uniref:Centrosomin isoform X2 n=1 Tax=Trichoplusia ni TaxID=7111 RepID=A0A7E5WB05_TRINI|nr:centrosomin isoform X2 [Trichoplusia ni]XP_026737889.1 centrosomin isoform X2 [Trichoplusia ni]XP_026737890.1 centrosomin isoform X2 [Trichoplusia ni]